MPAIAGIFHCLPDQYLPDLVYTTNLSLLSTYVAADAAGSPRKEGSPDPNRCPPPPLDEDLGRGEREEGGHGVMQSFDYQHGHPFRRGFDDDFRDEGPPPREVFDYNHRPPHWDMHPPPHLPPMGPGGPFDPWGPPPPHLPPPLDLPPPIPYYDLPAGLMVALVPVSRLQERQLA